MTEKKLKEIGSRFFDLYPNREKLYATEDGNVFLDRNPAIDHARKAKIKWYELTKNSEPQTDIDPELQMKELLEREALTIDHEKGEYKDMLRILSGLHLMPESKKKADVQSAFAALVEKLQADITDENPENKPE